MTGDGIYKEKKIDPYRRKNNNLKLEVYSW